MSIVPADVARAARDAHRHAETLIAEVAVRYPDAWRGMDLLRTGETGVRWPDWCLVPMAAAAAAVNTAAPGRPGPIAQVAALYAWRFTRSVYVIEPDLMQRLLNQVPDSLNLADLTGLPEWCIYVTGVDVEWPGLGMWMHLEHDLNTGRPELRLLLDLGGGIDDMLPIPVYLDRDTVTEALADMRATTLATLGQGGRTITGQNVRGGAMDAAVAGLADRVDAYLAVGAYLARPEADLLRDDRPGARPVRYRSLPRERAVWAVGYTN